MHRFFLFLLLRISGIATAGILDDETRKHNNITNVLVNRVGTYRLHGWVLSCIIIIYGFLIRKIREQVAPTKAYRSIPVSRISSTSDFDRAWNYYFF